MTPEQLQTIRVKMAADMQRRPRAGAVWLVEGFSDHMEPIERPIYLDPGTPYGLTGEQLLDQPVERQAEVFQNWVRANFDPAPPEVQANLGPDFVSRIRQRLNMQFGDPRIGLNSPAIRLAAERLEADGPVWIQRPENPESLRREALHRLGVFEAALRKLEPPCASVGHNNPPEPIDDLPLSSADYGDALNAVTETRQELNAEQLDVLVLRKNKAQRFLKCSLGVIDWLARKTRDVAATELIKALGWPALTAVGTAAAPHLAPLARELAQSALHLVEVLQRF